MNQVEYQNCPHCKNWIDNKKIPSTKIKGDRTNYYQDWYCKTGRCPHCGNFVHITTCLPSGYVVDIDNYHIEEIKQNEGIDTIIWDDVKKAYRQVIWNGNEYVNKEQS